MAFNPAAAERAREALPCLAFTKAEASCIEEPVGKWQCGNCTLLPAVSRAIEEAVEAERERCAGEIMDYQDQLQDIGGKLLIAREDLEKVTAARDRFAHASDKQTLAWKDRALKAEARVEEAVARERERCAHEVESFTKLEFGWKAAIAAAIRNPTTEESRDE